MNQNIKYIIKSIPSVGNCIYAYFLSMHTRVDIVIVTNHNMDKEFLVEIVEAIYKEINNIELIGNCFGKESEISLVNKNAATAPVCVSNLLYEIISNCKIFNKNTFGLFDVTFDSKNRCRNMMQSIILNDDDKTIYYSNNDTYINLSGFLKGYCLDKVKDILMKREIYNFLINMGNSSIMAMGNAPFGNGWKVSFSDYFSKQKKNVDYVILHDQCLTTSGNGDYKQSHILDPVSGEYITNANITSVLTDSGSLGEVLSTTFFIAGEGSCNLFSDKYKFSIII